MPDLPQFYLVKTNANGDTLWTRTYGGTGNGEGLSVKQTQDGGYIVAGLSDASGYRSQVYLIKTNALGDTLWTRTYGETGDEWGFSVQQTQDTGYIIAGWSSSFGDIAQVYLIKTNTLGDTLWTRKYGDMGDDDGARSIQQTSDGGYIVAGWTTTLHQDTIQAYLLKTNALGDTLWTRAYGGGSPHHGRSVQQTLDGGYIVAGFTLSYGNNNWQVYLVKTDAYGDTQWARTYGGAGDNWGYSVRQTTDGGYIIAGVTESFGDSMQVYLIKTDANGNVGVETPVRQFDGSKFRQLKATPNPFTSFATLPGHEGERFSLYDISGRKVGTFQGDRVGEGLGPGVYFLRSSDNKGKPLRVVKVR